MRRCYEPKDKKYQRYGLRGIRVCDRWHDVNNFIDDNAAEYEPGKSIDRKDNNGHYAPENCRWTTAAQQNRNYSRNVIVEHDGRRLCVADWSSELGLKASKVYDRIARGWDPARALFTP